MIDFLTQEKQQLKAAKLNYQIVSINHSTIKQQAEKQSKEAISSPSGLAIIFSLGFIHGTVNKEVTNEKLNWVMLISKFVSL
ncbi:hypothetical protein [Catenovulum sediminis]|uniref:hypothetical protein n=1 Tax=Catenovulum sediminis TaxID=1740262 RepID=UPI00117CAE40|nr:hypothetical protein [Catenovulum sediminis]